MRTYRRGVFYIACGNKDCGLLIQPIMVCAPRWLRKIGYILTRKVTVYVSKLEDYL